jgi:hypothetical protein
MLRVEGDKYRVVRFDGSPRGDLCEMDESELLGYLLGKHLGLSAAQAVLLELKQEGVAAVDFEHTDALKTHVEIRRITK